MYAYSYNWCRHIAMGGPVHAITGVCGALLQCRHVFLVLICIVRGE